MEHIELHKLRSGEHIGKKVAVCGWVRTSRDSKNVAFAELNDGSELNHMQIVFDKAKFDDKTLAPMLALGSALRVVGMVEKGMKDESVEILPKAQSFWAEATCRIRSKKSGIQWNFCALFRTCACVPTRLTQCSACVPSCRMPYTSFFTKTAITTCTRP